MQNSPSTLSSVTQHPTVAVHELLQPRTLLSFLDNLPKNFLGFSHPLPQRIRLTWTHTIPQRGMPMRHFPNTCRAGDIPPKCESLWDVAHCRVPEHPRISAGLPDLPVRPGVMSYPFQCQEFYPYGLNVAKEWLDMHKRNKPTQSRAGSEF